MTVQRPATLSNERLAKWLAESLIFAVLALAATWPLARQATTHLPTGTERSATVPLFNLWTIWWNVDRLGHGYRGYWDAPIYFPARGTFALSEPQPLTGWLAWPLWHVLPSAALVYNVLVLLFLVLNGWLACQLLKRWRVTWPTALTGGAMVCLLPLVHGQLGVFQTLALWGVVWVMLELYAFQRQLTTGRAIRLAIALAACYLLCCYYGLFLSLLLLCAAPFLFGRRLLQGIFWRRLATTLAIVSVALAPVVIPQIQVARANPYQFPLKWVQALSATPADYRNTPWPQLIALPGPARHAGGTRGALSPGTLKIVLACGGIVFGLRTARRRRFTLFCLVMLLAAIVLGMGPRLQIAGLSPHHLLVKYYPGYAHARALFRFAFFVQLNVALLAALGLHGIALFVRRRVRATGWRFGVQVGVLVMGALAACEAWPRTPSMYRLPSVTENAEWIAALRDHGNAEQGVLFLPLPAKRTSMASLRTAEWMYFQIWHHRPLVNGYTATVPRVALRLEKKIKAFPSRQGVAALLAAGVTHCVLDRGAGAAIRRETMRKFGFECVVDDRRAGVQVWRISTL